MTLAPEPLIGHEARWIAALWTGLLIGVVAPLGATYAWLGAAIHRPANVALARALVGVLVVGVLVAAALPVWRVAARLLSRASWPAKHVFGHGALTLSLALWWEAPPVALALALAVALYLVREARVREARVRQVRA